MAKQLVYTSVPKGLWQASSGYCTVLSTEGLPRSLADYIESLSVYRIRDRDADGSVPLTPENYGKLLAVNPNNVSHVKFRYRQREVSVLLKTCLAGFDYSNRLRKLSHFLVLDDEDLSNAGPAWIAAQPNLFLGDWGGQPTLLQEDKPVPQGTLSPQVCRAWEKVTGDPGWAGVLA